MRADHAENPNVVKEHCFDERPHLSSCFMALWMQMEGKLHSTSSLFSSFALWTDFTKMTICKIIHEVDMNHNCKEAFRLITDNKAFISSQSMPGERQ